MAEFTYLYSLVLVIILLYILYIWITQDKGTKIPGPGLKGGKTDNTEDMAKAGGLHPYLLKLHAKYGPVVQYHMPTPVVSIASYQQFKEQSRLFDRPPFIFLLFESLITPHSIQYANGEDGKQRHTAYSQCFSIKSINNYIQKIEEKANLVVSKFEKYSVDDHVSINEHAYAFTIDVVLSCAFGRDITAQKSLEMKTDYIFIWDTLKNSQLGIPIDEGSELKKKLDIKINKIHDFFRETIKETETRLKTSDPNENMISDVISSLNLTDKEKMADLLTLFVGAFHTTANLIIWGIYYIAKFPNIQEKICREIEQLERKGSLLTTKMLSEMTFTRQVIDETLRCAVLVPLAARVNNEFDATLGEHSVPAGTPVIHALGVSLQDPERWPNPEKFDPERFSPENRKKIPSYGFEPFGSGKRKCPGYNLGIMETTMLLVKLLKRYKISLAPGQNDAETVYGLVTHPKEEILLQFQE